MFALIAAAALVVADAPRASSDDIQRDYQAAKLAAGRTPDDQVRLAYWCEAHGLDAERLRHLALAVLADPTNATARGLLGLVARDHRWLKPEAVADKVKADPDLAAKLAEYDAKRSATPYTADGQYNLALWAEERGLTEQARAHLTAVVRLDPKRDGAWKRLGYTKHENHWATEAEITTAKADAEAQKAADKKWKPLLEKWKADLDRPSRRADAEASLRGLADPRAVPSIGRVFSVQGKDAPVVARLLGQIDAPAASRALASLAFSHPSADIRRVATETLRDRDPREWANLLIPLIQKPVHFEVKSVNGPGSPGVLYVEGAKANVKRLYEPESLVRPTDRIILDRFGQPVVERVLASSAYSKGGRAFNPRVISGAGASYDDFYSSSNIIVGDLSNYFNSFMADHLVIQPDRFASQLQGMVRSASSVGELAAEIRSKQGSAAGGTRQLNVSGLDPNLTILSNGTVIDPRDAAKQTTAEYSLAQVMEATRKTAWASQQQLNADVASIEEQNRVIQSTNDRAVGILQEASGENLPAERKPWERWYVNLLGYAFVDGESEQKPTLVEVIPSGYQPEIAPSNIISQGFYVSGLSCFGAGTLVQTMTGPQPIEQIKVGDLVLTQSVSNGALGYHPVTVTHHNPPAATFRVKLGDDVVVASHFHRFWVARRGWVMARDLEVGDPVRTLGGVREVETVEAGKVELVYNLDVADDADFFAGASAALVHDNTLPDPRLIPFDLPQAVGKAVAAR